MLSVRATALALAVLGLSAPAWAEQMMYHADLSGAAQVPPVDSAATGTADVTVDTDAMTVTWTVTAEGLSGDPTAAHFHGPATAEESAPPVIDISANWQQGSAEITQEQADMINNGMTYINIHTEQYPDGEIRGQVMPAEAAQ